MAAGEPIRWGVIATSATARKRMLPAIARSAGHEAVLIVGRDPRKTAEFQQEFGIRDAALVNDLERADECEAVLRESSADAAYVSAPNALHGRLVVAALRAGKHVLCEKPMFLTPDEVEAARIVARSRLLDENFSYALSPAYEELERLVRENTVGDPVRLEIDFAFPAEARHRLRYSRRLGGGSFLDLGCYAIDLIVRLFGGEIEIVDAQARPPQGPGAEWLDAASEPVDAESRVTLRTASGLEARVSTSFERGPSQSVVLTGNRGTIRVRNLFRQEGDAPALEVIANGDRRAESPKGAPQEDLLLAALRERIEREATAVSPGEWSAWIARARVAHEISQRIACRLVRSGAG